MTKTNKTKGEDRVTNAKVYLEYVDSNIISAQTDVIAEPALISACGFILRETDKFITISLEIMTNPEEYRNQLSIPKIAIKKMRILK